MTSTLTEPPGAGEPHAPIKARNRILPSPVTGQEIVLIGVIAAIWIGLALETPAFLTAGSIQPLLVATAPIALIQLLKCERGRDGADSGAEAGASDMAMRD